MNKKYLYILLLGMFPSISYAQTLPLDWKINGLLSNNLNGIDYIDSYGSQRKIDYPETKSSDFSDQNRYNSVVSYRKNQLLTPKDFGVTGDGTVADAQRLQNYIDSVKPASITYKGLWPVDSSFNSSLEPYGRWTPNHNNASPIFFNLSEGAWQSDNTNIAMSGAYTKSPQEGTTDGDSSADIYEFLQNGGLHFAKYHSAGVDYGPAFGFEYHSKSDDHPHYFGSGEFNNTILSDFEGYDEGRSGQLIGIQVGVHNTHTKGFAAQEQNINFNGSYTGKAGHWDIVGGFADLTGEPDGGGWEHNLWEADAGGNGPITNHCDETPTNSNCGRQGIVIVPGRATYAMSNFSYTPGKVYYADYEENGNIPGNGVSDKYYNSESSTHVALPNYYSFTNHLGDTVKISGIFRTSPSEDDYRKITGRESNSISYTHYLFNTMGLNQGGSGYKVGDVLTSSNTTSPSVTVTSVDSNGKITGWKLTNPVNTTPTTVNGNNGDDWYSGGSGTGARFYINYSGVLYSINSYTIKTPGSGYKVGDVLSINKTSGAVVKSIDSNGGITELTITYDNKPYLNDPSFNTNISGGSGTGANIDINSIENSYLDSITGFYLAWGMWASSGNSFTVGNTYTGYAVDSNNISHPVVDIVADSTTSSNNNLSTYHISKLYPIPNNDLVKDLSTIVINSDKNTSDSQATLNVVYSDVFNKWAFSNSETGSGYVVGDNITLTSNDGTVIANAQIQKIWKNGAIDGNSIVMSSTPNVDKDYSGIVNVSGGSGTGGKLYVIMSATGSQFTMNSGLQSNYSLLYTGIPFVTYYNDDGSPCGSCSHWTWTSEDEYEWGTGFGINNVDGTYFSTGFYSDAIFMNSALDLSKAWYRNPSSSQIRLRKDFVGIDLSGDGIENDKNQNFLRFSQHPNADGSDNVYGLELKEKWGTSSYSAILLDNHLTSKFPGAMQLGTEDKGTFNSLYGGNFPLYKNGFTFMTGRSGSNNYDMFSANSAFTFFQNKSSDTANDGDIKAQNTTQVFKFDINTGSEIYTNLKIDGNITIQAVTYSNLPTNPNIGTEVFCTDCYSSLRDPSDTQLGVKTNWNGSRWNDMVGKEIQH